MTLVLRDILKSIRGRRKKSIAGRFRPHAISPDEESERSAKEHRSVLLPASDDCHIRQSRKASTPAGLSKSWFEGISRQKGDSLAPPPPWAHRIDQRAVQQLGKSEDGTHL